jgi:hypothetical protein
MQVEITRYRMLHSELVTAYRTIQAQACDKGLKMTDPTSGIALKVGIEVLSRVTPKGLAWIKSKFVGRDILIVGQARAGKTSLQRYLQYGLFTDPDSPRTRADKVTASFTIGMGRNESLHLQVRKVVDTVGQVSAATHATLVNEYRPHVLVIVLDASSPWQGDDESYSVATWQSSSMSLCQFFYLGTSSAES